jgi:hypothetical protein
LYLSIGGGRVGCHQSDKYLREKSILQMFL